MKNPPILISVVGFFAAMAGFAYIFMGLRMLGFDWFTVVGDLPAFEDSGIWGWLAIGVGVLWFVIAAGLWALQSWAWLAAMLIAGLSLLEAVIAMFQFPGTGIGLGMAILPIVMLFYLNSAYVKAAFGVDRQPPAA
jgi:hypothetical protein